MPDVVCDTSPLLYLHLTGQLDLLSQLYQRVVVPPAVVGELQQGTVQGYDVPRLTALTWMTEQPVSSSDVQRVSPSLDSGEREAIALTLSKPDPLLIVDDSAARAYAKSQGIPFTGTLGVLVKAKQAGAISAIRPCLDQLEQTGFYLSDRVRAAVLRLAGETPP